MFMNLVLFLIFRYGRLEKSGSFCLFERSKNLERSSQPPVRAHVRTQTSIVFIGIRLGPGTIAGLLATRRSALSHSLSLYLARFALPTPFPSLFFAPLH